MKTIKAINIYKFGPDGRTVVDVITIPYSQYDRRIHKAVNGIVFDFMGEGAPATATASPKVISTPVEDLEALEDKDAVPPANEVPAPEPEPSEPEPVEQPEEPAKKPKAKKTGKAKAKKQ